jgi:hypothetical protein
MKLLRHISSLGGCILLTLVFAISLFGLNPASASAATLPSSTPPTPGGKQASSQTVQQQIASLLKQMPGGKQIAWNQISYDNGHTIITMRPLSPTQPFDATGRCQPGAFSTGWYCLFYENNYTSYEVDSSSRRCSGDQLYLPNWFNGGYGVGSFVNNTGYVLSFYFVNNDPYQLGGRFSYSSDTHTLSGGNDIFYYTQYVYAC